MVQIQPLVQGYAVNVVAVAYAKETVFGLNQIQGFLSKRKLYHAVFIYYQGFGAGQHGPPSGGGLQLTVGIGRLYGIMNAQRRSCRYAGKDVFADEVESLVGIAVFKNPGHIVVADRKS